MVPSRIPSIKPAMVVMGVLSSCDTLAMKLRRAFSPEARESAMLLKAAASWPISSWLETATRTEKFPSPKARAAAAMLRSGWTIR